MMPERIALGFCNNVDYEIVWNAETLEDLALRYQIRRDEPDPRIAIQSERDLVVSILGFMQAGAGGERFAGASDLIEGFAARFAKKITLGGTSVRAAIAMRKLGYTSALHLITRNDDVRRLIPADSPYVCGNAKDSFYPHLIVQFRAGDRLRAGDIDIRAPQSNRVIYHCNADRIALKLNPDFADLLTGAQVLLISGFNAMQSERLLLERLRAAARLIDQLPRGAQVFLEDGGYYNPSFRRLVLGQLGRRIDIFSMNEDELQEHLGRKIDLGDSASVRRALEQLRQRLAARILVVHTRHWALAHGQGAVRCGAALKAGVTMATTRFCFGDEFTAADYCELESMAPSAENESFAESINSAAGGEFRCAPVAEVDQGGGTTIGLGDAFVGGFLPALVT